MTVRKLDLDNIAGCKSLAHAKPGDWDVIQQFRDTAAATQGASSNGFLRAEFGRLRTISSGHVPTNLPVPLAALFSQEDRLA